MIKKVYNSQYMYFSVVPLSHNEQLVYISMYMLVIEHPYWYGVHIGDFLNTLPIWITTWCNMNIYVFRFPISFIFTSHWLGQVDSVIPYKKISIKLYISILKNSNVLITVGTSIRSVCFISDKSQKAFRYYYIIA